MELCSALQRVAPAMSKEATRYYLNGVCLDYRDRALILVATDGRLLHNVRLAASVEAAEAFALILPARLVELLLKQKPSKAADCTIALSGLDVRVEVDGQTFADHLIDGTFPDWRRVVPAAETPFYAGFNVSYLKTMLKAMKAGKVRQVVLHAQPRAEDYKGDQISGPIVSHDEQGGEYVLMPMRVDGATIDGMKGRAIADAQSAA